MRHLGVYYMLVACLFFSVTGAFAKALGAYLPSSATPSTKNRFIKKADIHGCSYFAA